MTIGQRIKKYRTKRGYTLRQLERLSGVSNAFICQVENGRGIGTEKLIMLARALNVRASTLLGER